MQSFRTEQQYRTVAGTGVRQRGKSEKENEEEAQNDIVPQPGRESANFYQASVGVRGGSSGLGR